MRNSNQQAVMECIDEIKSTSLAPYKALRRVTLYAAIDSLDQYFIYINYEPAHAWHHAIEQYSKNIPKLSTILGLRN